MLCSKSYFAAGFTLGGHEVNLLPAEFPGVLLLWMQDLISGAMQFKHFFWAPSVEDHDVQMMNLP